MGMFDYVDYECVCPVCHSKVDGFQSKSSDCLLDTKIPADVDNFYSTCDKCGCWIEFTKTGWGSFERIVKGKERKVIPKHIKEISIS